MSTTVEERARSKTWGFWEDKGTFFREWNDRLIADLEAAVRERDRLEAHILDIDAHATPSGSLDGEAVTTYILTAGALHRALGTVGHSAAKVVSSDDTEWMDAPLGPSKEPQHDAG